MNSIQTHITTKGDTRTALGLRCMQSGKPIDWTGKTAQFFMTNDDGEIVIAESTAGVTAHPAIPFTCDADGNWLTSKGHIVDACEELLFSSTGTLPGGLEAGTRYFPVAIERNRFQVSLAEDGTPITITDGGTGNHKYIVVGSVQKVFTGDDVSVAGDYWAYFTCTEDGRKDTIPHDGKKMRVRIVEVHE